MMTIHSIACILEDVKTAGRIALEAQQAGHLVRDYKSDGSVVTEIDLRLDSFLSGCIERDFPQANLLTEEAPHPFDLHKSYTFAIDPIDGSDVYSQGMHGWCVSLGLLDQHLQPIGGVIYAPRLDLLLFADVGLPATLNGISISIPDTPDPLSEKSNLMVSSRMHHEIELSRFPGKIRNIGSAALHLSFPLIYPAVFGAIQSANVHAWDIAAAQALIRSLSFEMGYLGGGQIDYRAMMQEGKARDMIISCARERVAKLREILPRLA
jgi:fructose-1,6-bisphosphatase/inositol monophosphatase family enzyme